MMKYILNDGSEFDGPDYSSLAFVAFTHEDKFRSYRVIRFMDVVVGIEIGGDKDE